MRFTKEQYEKAIEALTNGMGQLEPTAESCHICGDAHFAGECRHNPLKAMAMCVEVGKAADDFHNILHWFAGYQLHMGEQVGPAATTLPEKAKADSQSCAWWCERLQELFEDAPGWLKDQADHVAAMARADSEYIPSPSLSSFDNYKRVLKEIQAAHTSETKGV